VSATATQRKNEVSRRLHLQPHFSGLKLSEIRRSTVSGWVAQQVTMDVGVPSIEAAIRLMSAIFESAER